MESHESLTSSGRVCGRFHRGRRPSILTFSLRYCGEMTREREGEVCEKLKDITCIDTKYTCTRGGGRGERRAMIVRSYKTYMLLQEISTHVHKNAHVHTYIVGSIIQKLIALISS